MEGNSKIFQGLGTHLRALCLCSFGRARHDSTTCILGSDMMPLHRYARPFYYSSFTSGFCVLPCHEKHETDGGRHPKRSISSGGKRFAECGVLLFLFLCCALCEKAETVVGCPLQSDLHYCYCTAVQTQPACQWPDCADEIASVTRSSREVGRS